MIRSLSLSICDAERTALGSRPPPRKSRARVRTFRLPRACNQLARTHLHTRHCRVVFICHAPINIYPCVNPPSLRIDLPRVFGTLANLDAAQTYISTNLPAATGPWTLRAALLAIAAPCTTLFRSAHVSFFFSRSLLSRVHAAYL